MNKKISASRLASFSKHAKISRKADLPQSANHFPRIQNQNQFKFIISAKLLRETKTKK